MSDEQPPPSRIFISYRRDDSRASAGRLYESLRAEFGHDRVFKDVDNISLGEDFRLAVDEAISGSIAMVVVIGRQWAPSSLDTVNSRLADPADIVRYEVAQALERDIKVFPVLVDNATMPAQANLPEEIREITFRNAASLDHDSWTRDIRALIDTLGSQIAAAEAQAKRLAEARARRLAEKKAAEERAKRLAEERAAEEARLAEERAAEERTRSDTNRARVAPDWAQAARSSTDPPPPPPKVVDNRQPRQHTSIAEKMASRLQARSVLLAPSYGTRPFRGAVRIGTGLFFLLLAVVVAFDPNTPDGQTMSTGSRIGSFIFYAVLAVVLLWSGVRAWRRRGQG